MQGESVTDEDLLMRIAQKDQGALAALAGRHGVGLDGYLRRLGVDDLEDVLQDLWLAVWRYAHTFAGRASARTWLYRVARSAAIRHARRPAGAPPTFSELDDEASLGVHAGWGQNAYFSGESLVTRALVHRALKQLAPADREILFWVDMEGLALDEVHALLGESTSACKSRLHRARLRFMAAVRELDDAGPAEPSRGGP